MLTNIREHWAEFAAIRAELKPDPEGAVYIISKEKRRLGVKAGCMSCQTPHVAALMLVQDTHRLAEPHEIEAWKTEQAEKKRLFEEQAAKKSAKVQINMGDFLNTLVAGKLSQDQAAMLTSNAPPLVPPAVPQHGKTKDRPVSSS